MVTKTYTRDIRKVPSVHGPSATWSEKQKYEAVALYRLLGNLKTVSNTTGVPYDTMRKWHTEDWWFVFEREIAKQSRAELTGKLGKVAEKAIKAVEDRLENGDFVFNPKTGDIVRKPVNAREANKILTDSVDRTILIDKLSLDDKVAQTQEKLSDRLDMISKAFRDIAKSNRMKGTVIDVVPEPEAPTGPTGKEMLDAIYEERQERLLSGERALQLETGEREEEGRAEQSPSNDDQAGQGVQG